MTHTFDEVWSDVKAELSEAKGIAFDGCHKIYILMDNAQVHEMAGYGYGFDEGSFLFTKASLTSAEMLALIKKWYVDSCGLKFVQSVATVEGDPNKGFDSLIPQGYQDEFCQLCGEIGAEYDGTCDDCREDEQDECERCGTLVESGALNSSFYCEDCEEDEDKDEDK
jgi:hypothetical protein